jgi:hypothetical protein
MASWPNLRYYPNIWLEELKRKTTKKSSLSQDGVPVEIRPGRLLYAKPYTLGSLAQHNLSNLTVLRIINESKWT